jgi:hypothetical protein
MSIAKKIQRLRLQNNQAQHHDFLFMQSSPLDRARAIAQEQLNKEESYRFRILRNVSTFTSLSEETIREAIHLLEKCDYIQGDVIIKEGHVGDSFYILEEGVVEITKRKDGEVEHIRYTLLLYK